MAMDLIYVYKNFQFYVDLISLISYVNVLHEMLSRDISDTHNTVCNVVDSIKLNTFTYNKDVIDSPVLFHFIQFSFVFLIVLRIVNRIANRLANNTEYLNYFA